MDEEFHKFHWCIKCEISHVTTIPGAEERMYVSSEWFFEII